MNKINITIEEVIETIDALKSDPQFGRESFQELGDIIFKDENIQLKLQTLVGLLNDPLTAVLSAYASGFILAICVVRRKLEIEALKELEKLT